MLVAGDPADRPLARRQRSPLQPRRRLREDRWRRSPLRISPARRPPSPRSPRRDHANARVVLARAARRQTLFPATPTTWCSSPTAARRRSCSTDPLDARGRRQRRPPDDFTRITTNNGLRAERCAARSPASQLAEPDAARAPRRGARDVAFAGRRLRRACCAPPSTPKRTPRAKQAMQRRHRHSRSSEATTPTRVLRSRDEPREIA